MLSMLSGLSGGFSNLNCEYTHFPQAFPELYLLWYSSKFSSFNRRGFENYRNSVTLESLSVLFGTIDFQKYHSISSKLC